MLGYQLHCWQEDMLEEKLYDPWVSLERAKYFATNWGSEFINIGKAGHVNVASGHREWNQGLDILKQLG